jgi:hypothetical protein
VVRWRQAVELATTGDEIGKLVAIARSRTEKAFRVERAGILLAYQANPSFFTTGQKLASSGRWPTAHLRRLTTARDLA